MELSDSGIFQIVCENEVQREALIGLITGTQVENGECELKNISTNSQLKQYKRKVDIIDADRLDSSLNVRNYLTFYAMVTGIYDEQMQDKIDKLLIREGLGHLLEAPFNETDILSKIKLRGMAACLRNSYCLVGKDLLTGLTKEQQDAVIHFLKEHFVDKHYLCLLFEKIPRNDIEEVFVVGA